MGLPLYDCAVRTSVVTSAGALVQLVPPAVAVGSASTARIPRLRQVAISNTTATGFGVGLGIATAAAGTPATAGTIMRRSGTVAMDPTSACLVWSTFATTPTAPTGYNARLWVPGSQMVVWVFEDGEELLVPPAATPLPFCVFNTGTGQVADVTLTWEE